MYLKSAITREWKILASKNNVSRIITVTSTTIQGAGRKRRAMGYRTKVKASMQLPFNNTHGAMETVKTGTACPSISTV